MENTITINCKIKWNRLKNNATETSMLFFTVSIYCKSVKFMKEATKDEDEECHIAK